jgi:tripartite-type tricarboxylate transporter receptor subunit TctC
VLFSIVDNNYNGYSSFMKRREFLLAAAASAAATVHPGAIADTEWPARPITLIVSAAPGSGTDIMARELALRLGPALKQSVIVDNKPGGSGTVAIQALLRQPADGYALLYSNGASTVMAAALLKSLPYDISKDLAPIAQTVVGGVMLSVNKDFPAKDLKGLIEHVKANPGKYSYGTTGIASAAHLMMEWLKVQTGMQITHVPYRQGSQMFTEMSAGIVQMGWSDPASALPFLESGKMRGIALSGTARVPRTPDVGTMGEQGYHFDAGWFGVFAKASTPRNIVQRFSEGINKIQALPQTAARLAALNLEPPPIKTSEEFRAIVLNDLQSWKKVVEQAGVKVE